MAGFNDYRQALTVEGLPGFVSELKAMDKRLPHLLQVANKKTAMYVADRAAVSYRSLGKAGARVVDAMSVRATQQAASVRLDPTAVPGVLGVEFGAHRDKNRFVGRRVIRGWNQFPEWTGKGENAGRALWPTVRSSQRDITDFYDKALDEVFAVAFPD